MKNNVFDISFNKNTGAVSSIVLCDDKHKMNWCSEDGCWGKIHSINRCFNWDNGRKLVEIESTLESFSENRNTAISVYSNGLLRITVERFFAENESFSERYTVENIHSEELFIGQDNFGIEVPFNDRYSAACECMVRHCHAHIWAGQNTAYINAIRMGESDQNLGLVLTRGSIESYSIENCDTNNRGNIILNSTYFLLLPTEKYVIEWEIFPHKGNDDFYKKLVTFPQSVYVKAENHTVFLGEEIEFCLENHQKINDLKISVNGENIDAKINGSMANIKYKPEALGEYRFEISLNGIKTYTEFLVSEKLEKIIENRINFIIDNQQYKNKDSNLYGAYLIYDNKEKHLVFDDFFPDHNACHERVGMALLLAKYLQSHKDQKANDSLMLFIEFLKREFYEESTGEVFGNIRKDRKGRIRLYDSPWIMQLFSEMYLLTGDTYYTDQIVKIVDFYYSNGGAKFYPNGISFAKVMEALKKAENKDSEKVFDLFKTHAHNIINIGTNYPPHEVTYEQTIVTPAVNLISDMGILTGDSRYLAEAEKHIINLERFSGHQPSFHLDQIPIRYWDDFWFGKSALFGDTFPHYWSCLTARAYNSYYKISKEEKYKAAAEKCLRNCLCLFTPDGRGSCAYVYPFKSNGQKGGFYDEWANDQDFALYFSL